MRKMIPKAIETPQPNVKITYRDVCASAMTWSKKSLLEDGSVSAEITTSVVVLFVTRSISSLSFVSFLSLDVLFSMIISFSGVVGKQ